MNNEDKRKIKVGIAIAAFAVTLYYVLQNFSDLQSVFDFCTEIISPFFYGICFVFVLNILANFYEKKVFGFKTKKVNPKWEKARRPLCIVLTIFTFLGIIAALVAFIIPQLMLSTVTIAEGVQPFIANLQNFINSMLADWGVSTDLNATLTTFLIDFSDKILKFVTASVPQIIKTTMDITSGVFDLLFGFIIAIYMLSNKESLLRNSKRILYAYVPKNKADYANHVYRRVNTCFSGFVSGQLTEAVIVGVLCFIGMKLFNMEYALLISVIVGVTNIIPIIGPIIGAVPGAIIMLMIDPMQAVWFVVFIIVLQQVESNLIYPKVVGDSIGLPGLWVIFAIIVGGGLFGLAGVILGVPVFAVIYALLAENTAKRLNEKSIKL